MHLRRLRDWAVEHPILTVFVVAFVVRGVVAVGINVLHDGTLFADDRFFFDLAHDKATGADAQWDPYESDLYTRTATFLWPLTGVFIVTGTTLLAGQLLVAIAGAGAAALTTAVGLRALRPPFALFAGLVVAVLPSMVLWSSLTLKDAFVWCTVAGLGFAVCELSGSAKRFIAVAAATVVLVVLLSHLRDHSTVVALWALAASLAIGPGADRRRRATFGVAMLLVMPAFLGYGVAGVSFFRDSTTSLEERREGNAVGASSALTCDRGRQGLEGKIEHLPCGFPAVMLRPYPWESADSTGVRLATRGDRVVSAAGRRALRRHPLVAPAAMACLPGRERGNDRDRLRIDRGEPGYRVPSPGGGHLGGRALRRGRSREGRRARSRSRGPGHPCGSTRHGHADRPHYAHPRKWRLT